MRDDAIVLPEQPIIAARRSVVLHLLYCWRASVAHAPPVAGSEGGESGSSVSLVSLGDLTKPCRARAMLNCRGGLIFFVGVYGEHVAVVGRWVDEGVREHRSPPLGSFDAGGSFEPLLPPVSSMGCASSS